MPGFFVPGQNHSGQCCCRRQRNWSLSGTFSPGARVIATATDGNNNASEPPCLEVIECTDIWCLDADDDSLQTRRRQIACIQPPMQKRTIRTAVMTPASAYPPQRHGRYATMPTTTATATPTPTTRTGGQHPAGCRLRRFYRSAGCNQQRCHSCHRHRRRLGGYLRHRLQHGGF